MSDWRSYHSHRSLSSVSHSSVGRQRQAVEAIGHLIGAHCSRPWPLLKSYLPLARWFVDMIAPQRLFWLSFFFFPRLFSFTQHSFCTFCPGCQIYVYIKVHTTLKGRRWHFCSFFLFAQRILAALLRSNSSNKKVSSLPLKPHSAPRLLCADIHSYYCQFQKFSWRFQRSFSVSFPRVISVSIKKWPQFGKRSNIPELLRVGKQGSPHHHRNAPHSDVTSQPGSLLIYLPTFIWLCCLQPICHPQYVRLFLKSVAECSDFLQWSLKVARAMTCNDF